MAAIIWVPSSTNSYAYLDGLIVSFNFNISVIKDSLITESCEISPSEERLDSLSRLL